MASEGTASPPTLGLAAAADLWLWGALGLFAPTYLGISGWDWVLYSAGFVMVALS
jgi:hypothetical protein